MCHDDTVNFYDTLDSYLQLFQNLTSSSLAAVKTLDWQQTYKDRTSWYFVIFSQYLSSIVSNFRKLQIASIAVLRIVLMKIKLSQMHLQVTKIEGLGKRLRNSSNIQRFGTFR